MVLPTAILTMLRMSRDELGVRPLAVAGELQVGLRAAPCTWLGAWEQPLGLYVLRA